MQKMGWWQAHCILYTQLCEEAGELEAEVCQSNTYYLRVTSSTCKNMSQVVTHVLHNPSRSHAPVQKAELHCADRTELDSLNKKEINTPDLLRVCNYIYNELKWDCTGCAMLCPVIVIPGDTFVAMVIIWIWGNPQPDLCHSLLQGRVVRVSQ